MDDWVSACRKVKVAGVRCWGGNRKTWKECVVVWMITWKCLVHILNGRYSGMCGGASYGQTSNQSVAWKKWTFSKYVNDDDEDSIIMARIILFLPCAFGWPNCKTLCANRSICF